jgi:hypothetical protein
MVAKNIICAMIGSQIEELEQYTKNHKEAVSLNETANLSVKITDLRVLLENINGGDTTTLNRTLLGEILVEKFISDMNYPSRPYD